MLKVTANKNKTFSCSLFSLRVYKLTSLRVYELFVAIMICVIRVIRSLFFTRRDGEMEVGSKATEVPMAQGEIEKCHTDC